MGLLQVKLPNVPIAFITKNFQEFASCVSFAVTVVRQEVGFPPITRHEGIELVSVMSVSLKHALNTGLNTPLLPPSNKKGRHPQIRGLSGGRTAVADKRTSIAQQDGKVFEGNVSDNVEAGGVKPVNDRQNLF